ncbi:MAG: hypothetical protein HQ542_00875 [Bacteroidia bacterium]|nr:hypothetical protein [Bacteroidia bacterium]
MFPQPRKSLPISREFTIHTYSLSDGVPPILYAITQTPDGFLILGSDQGVYSFDGINFKSLDADSMKVGNECRVILILRDSSILCGFNKGNLFQYGRKGATALGTPEIFQQKTITSLLQTPDGSIWIGTDGAGLFRYHDSTFTAFMSKDGLPSNHITTIISGAPGVIYAGTQGGLVLLQNGAFQTIRQQEGLSRNYTLSLLYDSNGRLWIGTHGGLNVMEGDHIRHVQSEILTLEADITAIQEDHSGDIWFASNGDGLYRICQTNSAIQRITDRDGLPSNLIKCLFVDHEATIWAGFDGNFGLSQLQKRVVNIYTEEECLSGNNILPLFPAQDNRVWVGNASGGVDCYSDGVFTQHGKTVDFGTNPIFSITSDTDSNIWIGGRDSLIIYNGKEKVRSVSFGYPERVEYHAILTASNGAVWIGSNQGIQIIREQDTVALGIEDGLSDDKIICFAEDASGGIWIGTQDGGLNRYYQGLITHLTTSDGLSDNLVLCIYIDAEGILWVGAANGGLNRIDIKTGEVFTFGKEEGLDYVVTQVMEDDYGYLWIGVFDGIICVKKEALQKPVGKADEKLDVKVFSCSDSDQQRLLNAGIFPSGCKLHDGTLWFPTDQGIAVIHPERSHGKVPFPHVVLESIIVNSIPQPLQSSYVFPPAVIHLEINFTAPTFIYPERIRFRYKLVGYDNDWEVAGEDRKAHYTKVPHGSYTFQVQVSNHLGQWSDQIISIPFKIKPYFYQRIWFLVLCGVVGIFILYAIYRYRIRQIREKELEVLVEARTKELKKLNRELDQRVLDRTAELAAANQELEAFTYSVSHDLRAPVRRIEGLVEAIIEDSAAHLDEMGKDLLSKVADSSIEMGLLIEEFLKLARIARQEIDKTELNLSHQVKEITEELAEANPERKVSIKIEPDILVNGDPRLMRIALQNLLNNAWKYTGKKEHPEVIFGCKEKEGQKVLFIQDNGVGFDMGHYEKLFTPFHRLHSDDQFTGTGIGLATVKRIIIKHGGKIWAQAEPGNGCTFFFTL